MILIYMDRVRNSRLFELWEHVRDYVTIAVSSIAAILVYKHKQKDKLHKEHENKQDSRIENLERRANNLERNMGVIEERTQHIMTDCKEIKDMLKERR